MLLGLALDVLLLVTIVHLVGLDYLEFALELLRLFNALRVGRIEVLGLGWRVALGLLVVSWLVVVGLLVEIGPTVHLYVLHT